VLNFESRRKDFLIHKMGDIDKLSKKYAKQGLFLSVGMFLIALIIMQVCNLPEIFTPLVISVVFSIVIDVADSIIWRKIAKRDASYLPTFYTAVSGFRMLLALITLFAYYLIVGRENMLVFFVVFMAFYLVLLLHHTSFFMRVSNRS